jgi:hypothetical protein
VPIRVVDLATAQHEGQALRIEECLNPADYRIDLSRYFFA